MYHVTTIGAFATLLYLLSITGYKTGLITRKEHHATWNLVLLATFIFTATAGILLALQATYKWESRPLREILKWHVEIGTGMSFVAIFHLSWHIKYYLNLFRRPHRTEPAQEGIVSHEDTNLRSRYINLFLTGLLTGIMQLIFIKEIMNLSGGYELISGIIFFSWFILSATGAYLSGRREKARIERYLFMLPLSAILSVLLLVVSSRLLLSTGEYPTLFSTLLITLVSLLPLCFTSGSLFILLSAGTPGGDRRLPGRGFAVETTGSIVSGIIIAIAGGSILGNYQMVIISTLIVSIALARTNGWLPKVPGTVVTLLAVALIFLSIIIPPDRFMRSLFLRGTSIEKSIDTKYGNITVTGYNGETSILYNHRLYSYTGDPSVREENIHYAMLQKPDARSVLLVSGSIKEHIGELHKYPLLNRIVYLEKDPGLIREEHIENLAGSDSSVVVINMDAFSYIRKCSEKFDVVIMLIPFPSNLESNRYFTGEFYRMIGKILNPGGVYMTTAGAATNYPGVGAGRSLSITMNTLKEQFSTILPVKGIRLYIVASDNPLTINYPRLAESTGINNQYVNSFYLDSAIMAFNSNQLSGLALNYRHEVNSLSEPLLVYHNQRHELSKENTNSRIVFGILALILSIPLFTGRRNSRKMYTASMNLAGIEIIALVTMQSTIGSMYQYTGLLVSALMAGLAAGAATKERFYALPNIPIMLIITVITVLIALGSQPLLSAGSGILVLPIILVTVFLPAFLTGRLYSVLSSSAPGRDHISRLYGSDLIGGAAGFLMVSSFLLPFAGIRNSLFVLAIINFAGYLSTIWKGTGKHG